MTRSTLFLVALSLTAACITPGDDFASVLPDDRLLVDFRAELSPLRSDLGTTSEYVQLTADVTSDVNGLIGEVLEGIEHITSFDPTWTDGGSRALWGPWEDGGVNGRLWVEQRDDGSYAWAVDAKLATEGEDAWAAVYAGEIDAGASEEASAGRFAIDFAGASRFDPDHDVTGSFYVEYDVDGAVVDARAGFDDFSEDGGPLADAGYAYSQDGEGNGSMDLAILVDEYGGPEPELHIVRTRWTSLGEGRADVYLTQGEFGELVYTATECWDDSSSVVFYEDNYEFTRNGDEADCAFGEPDFNEDGPGTAR